MYRFTYGERKLCENIKKSENIMKMPVCQIFFYFLCFNQQLQLLKMVIFRPEFTYLSERCPKKTWKSFNTEFRPQWKQIQSKAKFSTFLELNCADFRLRLFERPYSYQNVHRNYLLRGLEWAKSNKVFPDTIIHKIFKTNSSFHVK